MSRSEARLAVSAPLCRPELTVRAALTYGRALDCTRPTRKNRSSDHSIKEAVFSKLLIREEAGWTKPGPPLARLPGGAAGKRTT